MNFLGSFLSAIKPRTDDDPIDRVNYYYTVVIILVFSITISAKQYVGAPIQCWVPAFYTGAWEQGMSVPMSTPSGFSVLGHFMLNVQPLQSDDAADRINYYYTVVVLVVFCLTLIAKQYVGAPIQCWIPAFYTRAWEQFLSTIKPRHDDDTADRLNYYLTVVILLVFSITISAKQYVGAPIQCWVPAFYKPAWEEYAENYCFVQNTYWVRMDQNIPDHQPERSDRQIGYYQWVPFILAIEAVMFYMPVLIWRQFNWQSGIDVESIIKMASDTANIQSDNREKAVKTVTRHIEDAIELQSHLSNSAGQGFIVQLVQCGRTKGIYVTTIYICVKCLYLVNIVAQFMLLNAFLGPRYLLWGARIFFDLLQGIEWEESGEFPRVTMCDFEVRVLGNIHRHTIQCVLMINMFNEKIFVYLWWWFMFVAVVTLISLFHWFSISSSSRARHGFVMKYLRVAGTVGPEDRYAVDKFIHEALRPDGVFVLRMLAAHSGDLVATDIIAVLWENFKQRQPKHSMLYVDSEGQLASVQADQGFLEQLHPPPPAGKSSSSQPSLANPQSATVYHRQRPLPPRPQPAVSTSTVDTAWMFS